MQNKIYKIFLLTLPLLIVLAIFASITLGFKPISFEVIVESFTNFNPDNVDHQIIINTRLPRAIGAMLIGIALATSGTIMQGITNNYLAEPTIMGVSDGAGLLVTIAMVIIPNASMLSLTIFSLIGSLLGVGSVLFINSFLPTKTSTLNLALIGVIVGMFFSGISSLISSYFKISQDISFWYNARLNILTNELLTVGILFFIVGIVLAILLRNKISVLSLGEEMANSLGLNVTRTKVLSIIAVAILTGVSVALVGKIGFIGLIIPHITRMLIGVDYRRLIIASGLLGGFFLIFADVVSRYVNFPFETPVGIITSLIGVPFFLYLTATNGGRNNV